MLPSDDALDALRARVRPFEEAELALVRAVVSLPPWISEPDENALRYALNLARVEAVRAPDGRDVPAGEVLAPYRDDVLAAAAPLLAPGPIDLRAVSGIVPQLATHARAWRGRVLDAFAGRLPPGALDREVCEKALVVVCGGGGGVTWSYLGAYELLEQYGLAPRLLAGTSMGAVLQLFRARRIRYRADELHEVVGGLSMRRIFRFLQTEARYGLPAPMRLYLRAAVGEYLAGPDGHPLTLGQLAIPLVVAATGVRSGALPRDPTYYEHLLDLHVREPRPSAVARMFHATLQAIGELVAQRDRLARVYLGADDDTRDFDAIDAVGFSSALPGVVHYDVLRDDPRMHAILGALFERHELFRLVDGGLVDNLPARAAWAVAQRGGLGTRNVFVLGLEGFGPKLAQPLWLGLARLAAQNVARNRPYVHVLRSFQRVLSPLEIVPEEQALTRAIQAAKSELLPDMPLVARMCRAFPALA